VDLAAVKTAATPELSRGTVAALRNARSLVEDAELLTGARRPARAYSLAALAVEEVGKAACLATLAALPEKVRAQAPVGRMLEWHQVKLVEGMLIATVPLGVTCLASHLAATQPRDLTDALDNPRASARRIDSLKQRGLYVDVDRSGRFRQPSELTEAHVRRQLDWARRSAASAANALLDPGVPDGIAHPGSDGIEFSRAVVSAFTEAGPSRSAEAAAEVLLNAVSKLQH
jgi:AbiV family abortive infection protein